jgi:hypothetical protein
MGLVLRDSGTSESFLRAVERAFGKRIAQTGARTLELPDSPKIQLDLAVLKGASAKKKIVFARPAT